MACDDESDGDGDTDTDTDTDTDADGDADGWPCEGDAASPQMRVTALHITAPSVLATGLLPSIVDGSIDTFTFLWLVDVDLTAQTMTTGSGTADAVAPSTDDAAFCSVSWNDAYPAAQNVPITLNGTSVTTTDPIATIDIPIYSESDLTSPLMTLPMSQVEIIDMNIVDGQLVGTPPDVTTAAFAADWTTDGELTGWIAVEDARGAVIEAMGATLCGLLSGNRGATPEEDCAGEPDTWPTPPATIPGTSDLGYELTASIGAGSVSIN